MILKNCTRMLLVAATLMSGLFACGQAQSAFKEPRTNSAQIALLYQATHANTVPGYGFWMQGGSLQASVRVLSHWSAVADLFGSHTGQMPAAPTGLDLMTITFGPRYSIKPSRCHCSIYGQALGGYARGSNSLFPNPSGSTPSADGVALLVGGGMDYRLSSRLSVRMLDANWLRTALSNGTTTVQNNLRLGSGIVLRF
jgi:peptidoglycan-associated lipoprotein